MFAALPRPHLSLATASRPCPFRSCVVICLAKGPAGASENGDGPRRPRGRPRKVPPDLGGKVNQSGVSDGVRFDERRSGSVPSDEQGHGPADLGYGLGARVPRRRGRPPKLPNGEQAQPSGDYDDVQKPVRRRGRPRSGSTPPGGLPARSLALRTSILQQLRLQSSLLRPPPSSWRKLMHGMTSETLIERLSELLPMLGMQAVRSMATRCPHIFLMKPTHIMSKLADLNVRLPLSRQRLLSIICRFPSILGVRAATVGERVTMLVQELNSREDFVLEMLSSQPALIGMSSAMLRHRIDLVHGATCMLPKWSRELQLMPPSTLARLLRCSDAVLQRLTFTFLRTANNGRKFHRIRAMSTICFMPDAVWAEQNPLFQQWVADGEADRRDGLTQRWSGWCLQPGDVDWWQDKASGSRSQLFRDEETEGPSGDGAPETMDPDLN